MPEFRKFLAQIIFIGVIGAAVAFGYAMSVEKVWRVTGKIVVVPSGTSPTAGQNLQLEAANTAELIMSPSFQERLLGDSAAYFADAKSVKNSSTVVIAFESNEENIAAVEDAVVRMPENIATYTRDVYNGAPFKYLLASDPEILIPPVQPAIYKYVFAGFGLGALVYFIYWLYFSAFFRNKFEQERGILPPVFEEKKATRQHLLFSPDLKPIETPLMPIETELPAEKIETMKSKPAVFVQEEKIERKPEAPKPVMKTAAAPANLPIADDESTTSMRYESIEPTDEEVKERLNRLMRGEL